MPQVIYGNLDWKIFLKGGNESYLNNRVQGSRH